MKKDVLVVLVTIPSNKAERLAEILLESRLCACVNIMKNLTSFFWWDKKIEKEKEALLFIKTIKKKYRQLEKAIRLNHPYTVPEIIGIEVAKIYKGYHKWLKKEVEE